MEPNIGNTTSLSTNRGAYVEKSTQKLWIKILELFIILCKIFCLNDRVLKNENYMLGVNNLTIAKKSK